MRILVLFSLAVAAVAAVPSNPQRIVGGSVAGIAQYPSIVSLLVTDNYSSWLQACAGIVINSRSVLTAAHCPAGDAVARWRFRAGSRYANWEGVVYLLHSYILHHQYNQGVRLNNDIAILRSASVIGFINDAVQPAIFAGSNYYLADNQVVWAAGWGDIGFNSLSSEILRHVQVWTINQDVCAARYHELNAVVNENMLCSGWLDVGGRNQCHGDAGGPLYHYDVVVGVYSWGHECAHPRYPGVSTRVSRFAAWIQANA